VRTTFLSQGRDLLFQLRASQQRSAEAGFQLASGLRVTKPSDSPTDAAGVVRTTSEIARLSQFRDNLESAQAELQAVDGSLARAGDAVNRALTLASQATSIAGNEVTRTQIRNDLEGIFRGLLLVANTSHADRFLFAGNSTDARPFTINENSPDGVVYEGSSASRHLLFPDGQPGQISLPGNAIFARPDQFQGAGRTPGLTGSVAPLPPAAVGVAFSGDVEGVISADLDGFFVAAAAPTIPPGARQSALRLLATTGS
jgi:flagellar hook-associated protein 3 FlgL